MNFFIKCSRDYACLRTCEMGVALLPSNCSFPKNCDFMFCYDNINGTCQKIKNISWESIKDKKYLSLLYEEQK